jgi:hypothetical protein
MNDPFFLEMRETENFSRKGEDSFPCRKNKIHKADSCFRHAGETPGSHRPAHCRRKKSDALRRRLVLHVVLRGP